MTKKNKTRLLLRTPKDYTKELHKDAKNTIKNTSSKTPPAKKKQSGDVMSAIIMADQWGNLTEEQEQLEQNYQYYMY